MKLSTRFAVMWTVLVMVAACSGTAANPGQQYQDAAGRVNAALDALTAKVAAAGDDPVQLAPLYGQYADALRIFETDVSKITGTADQNSALGDLLKVDSALEVAYRSASATTDAAAQSAALASVPLLEAQEGNAVNTVRVRLGLPPAPTLHAPPSGASPSSEKPVTIHSGENSLTNFAGGKYLVSWDAGSCTSLQMWIAPTNGATTIPIPVQGQTGSAVLSIPAGQAYINRVGVCPGGGSTVTIAPAP